ncbi:hypothetical protein QBC40DRAFT_12431 [Triangularia verruculosa]|uniref:GAR domain-containing protein n=1 Tax=Triangularia verruculosa TaxID=2587418 RepID=A0AAN6XN22_9PEZI|nr:hypothetical protein QBC40DRAFT_12431 [Triangularia verruculosa]
MDDPPSMTAAYYAAPRGRQLGSIPEHHVPAGPRTTDDLLLNLTPRAAVEAFQNPSGSLKASIDAATSFEQAFAMRAAMASSSIADWLEDLNSWPWPKGGGSAGFEVPIAKRRRVASSGDNQMRENTPNGDDQVDEDNKVYFGSLEAHQAVRYEKRIDEINHGLEELDIEEIKTQVLHNHIMPLSRPGTPLLDSGRSVTSALSTLARMDDLTALLTATLMQALPNLSKLTRLLSLWTFRLLVLRKIPVFLKSLDDAEVALQSGWHAIGVKSTKTNDIDAASSDGSPSATNGATVLSQKEHEVMKTVLERKVARTGRDLDAMLDLLEGQLDTLPEEWIDRVDSLEHDYGEWTVACEQKIREAELAGLARNTPEPKKRIVSEEKSPLPPPTPETNESKIIVEPVVVEEETSVSEEFDTSASSGREYFPFFGVPEEPTKTEPRSQNGINNTPQNPSKRLGLPIKFDRPDRPAIRVHEPSEKYDTNPIRSSLDGARKWSRFEENAKGVDHLSSFDGLEEEEKKDSIDLVDSSEDDRVSEALDGMSGRDTTGSLSYRTEDDFELTDGSEDFVPQPDLPVLPRSRRASDSGTVVHEASLARFMDFSSDGLDQGTPERPRGREVDLDRSSPDSYRSPSSPPALNRVAHRSMSVSFNDEPMIRHLPNISSSPRTPKTPNESSLFDNEISTQPNTPDKTNSPDEKLQQQISDILESVPAKIRLTSVLPPINLNPPDFKMPTARKMSNPTMKRSVSNMSLRSNGSRAGTPSFTLAPAFGRTPRQRPKPGNPEIKLYHLSRSNGEAPIKLFIRCVGERGERVMVRVGGGWADLGEYLKEYASHHGRRSAVAEASKVEVKDIPRSTTSMAMRETVPGSTPPNRPVSSHNENDDSTGALKVRKVRKSSASMVNETPIAIVTRPDDVSHTPSTGGSRSSSRLSWPQAGERDREDEIALGMAGPRAKQVEMSEESKQWVESVKQKVRLASGGEKILPAFPSASVPGDSSGLGLEGRFGELGKVGATKRLFRKPGGI